MFAFSDKKAALSHGQAHLQWGLPCSNPRSGPKYLASYLQFIGEGHMKNIVIE